MTKVLPALTDYLVYYLNDVLKLHVKIEQIINFLKEYILDKRCWYQINCYRYNDRVEWDVYKEDSSFSIDELIAKLIKVKL